MFDLFLTRSVHLILLADIRTKGSKFWGPRNSFLGSCTVKWNLKIKTFKLWHWNITVIDSTSFCLGTVESDICLFAETAARQHPKYKVNRSLKLTEKTLKLTDHIVFKLMNSLVLTLIHHHMWKTICSVYKTESL